MKASKLLEQLQKAIANHGDLDIYIYTNIGGYELSEIEIMVIQEENEKTIFTLEPESSFDEEKKDGNN